jgi:hypothetical protein
MTFKAPEEHTRSITISEEFLFELLISMTMDGSTKSFRIVKNPIPHDARNLRVSHTRDHTIVLHFDTWDAGDAQIAPVMQTVTHDEPSQAEKLREIKWMALNATGGLNDVAQVLQRIVGACRDGGATERLEELREEFDGWDDPRVMPGGEHVDAEVTDRFEIDNDNDS